MTFAEKLKQARENKGISQAELARRIGISRAAVSRYESGERTQISAPIVMSMAKCLDVNPLYLEGIEDDPAAKQGSVFEQLQKSEAIQFSLETSDAIRITLLLEAFSALNVKGRIEALKAISNLTYVPEYITSEGKMQGEVFALSDITALIEAVDRIAEKKRGIENG